MPRIQDKKLLHDLLNNLPHYIFWKDRNLVFRGCNKKFAEQFGYKNISDVIGKTDYDFPWARNLREKYNSDDMEIINTGEAKLDYEEEQVQLDGSIKTVLVSKVPLYDENNEITGILGIYTDISARKKMEEEIKTAKEKAEVANEELKKAQEEKINGMRILGASIAHELRTPLSSMNNAAHGLNQYLPKIIKGYQLAKENALPVDPLRSGVTEILGDLSQLILESYGGTIRCESEEGKYTRFILSFFPIQKISTTQPQAAEIVC